MGQSLLQRLGSDNRSVFILGVFLLFLIIGWFVPSFIIDQNNTLKVLLIMLASLAGGRLPAIMTGMELGVRNPTIVSVLFFCNLCWLLLMFPLIRSFYDNVVQVKVVGRLLHSAKERAIQGSRRVSSGCDYTPAPTGVKRGQAPTAACGISPPLRGCLSRSARPQVPPCVRRGGASRAAQSRRFWARLARLPARLEGLARLLAACPPDRRLSE